MAMTTQHGAQQPTQDAAGSLSSQTSEEADQLAAAFRPSWEPDAATPPPPRDGGQAPGASSQSATTQGNAPPSSGRESTASQHLAAATTHPRGAVVKRTMIGLAPPANLPPVDDDATGRAAPTEPPTAVAVAPVPAPPASAPVEGKAVPPAPKSESRVGVTSAAALANAPRGKASCEPKVIVEEAALVPPKVADVPAPAPVPAPTRDRSREEPTLVRPHPMRGAVVNATMELDEAQILDVASSIPGAPPSKPGGHGRTAPHAAPARAMAATVSSRAFDDSDLTGVVPKRSNALLVVAGVAVVAIAVGIFAFGRFGGGPASEPVAPAAPAALAATDSAPAREIPPPSTGAVEAPIVATPAPAGTTTSASTKHESAVAAASQEAPATRHAAPTPAPVKATTASATKTAAASPSPAARQPAKAVTTPSRATSTPKSAPKAGAGGIVRDDPF